MHFGSSKPAQAVKEKKIREKTPREKPKNDPRLIAAARELRDRWLEQVNAAPLITQGKYDVSRAIEGSIVVEMAPMKLLEAA